MRTPVGIMIAILAILAVGCSGDDEGDPPSPTAAAETEAPGETEVPPTGTPAQPPEATATPAPLTEFEGVFLEPRERKPDSTIDLSPRPESSFDAWDRTTVTLYDIKAGEQMAYEPGIYASLNSTATSLIYSPISGNAAGPGVLIDLATGDRTELPVSGFLRFIDDKRIFSAATDTIYDVPTGQQDPIATTEDALLVESVRGSERNLQPLASGNYLGHPVAYASGDCAGKPGYEACIAEQVDTWAIIDGETGVVLTRFRAHKAVPAGPDFIVITTTPQCDDGSGGRAWCAEVLPEATSPQERVEAAQNANATTNLFEVDLASGAATFIATLAYDRFSTSLIANAEYVAWTAPYCAPDRRTMVFDRESGLLTELIPGDEGPAFWLSGLSDDGRLGVGDFGPYAMLDLTTHEWQDVLPADVVDVQWVDDYQYATVGSVLGHGGLCP